MQLLGSTRAPLDVRTSRLVSHKRICVIVRDSGLAGAGSNAGSVSFNEEVLNSNLSSSAKISLLRADGLRKVAEECLVTKDLEMLLLKKQLAQRSGRLLQMKQQLHMLGLLEHYQDERMPLWGITWSQKAAKDCWTKYLTSNQQLMGFIKKAGLPPQEAQVADIIVASYCTLSAAAHDSPSVTEYNALGLELIIGKPLNREQSAVMACLCEAFGVGYKFGPAE